MVKTSKWPASPVFTDRVRAGKGFYNLSTRSLHSFIRFPSYLTGKGALKHYEEVMPRVVVNTSRKERRQATSVLPRKSCGWTQEEGEGRPWRKEPGAPSLGGLCTDVLPSEHGSWDSLATVSLSLPTPLFRALQGLSNRMTVIKASSLRQFPAPRSGIPC